MQGGDRWRIRRWPPPDLFSHTLPGKDRVTDEERRMLEQLLDAWRTNNRISLFLIERISDEGYGVHVWHMERRGFNRGIFTTLAHFVGHESHHRGSILLTLKQSGHKLDPSTSYGIWDWDRI